MLIEFTKEQKDKLMNCYNLLNTNDLKEISLMVKSRVLFIYSSSYSGFSLLMCIPFKTPIKETLELTTTYDLLYLIATTDEPIHLYQKEDELKVISDSLNIKLPVLLDTYSLQEVIDLNVCTKFEDIKINRLITLSKAVDSLRDKVFEKYLLLKGNACLTHSSEYVIEMLNDYSVSRDYVINYYMIPSLKKLQKVGTIQIGKNDTRVIFRDDTLYFSFNYLEHNTDSILSCVTGEFKFINNISTQNWKRLKVFNVVDLPNSNINLIVKGIINNFKSNSNGIILTSSNSSDEDTEFLIDIDLFFKALTFLPTKKEPSLYYNKKDNLLMVTDGETKVVFRGGE